MHFFGAQVPQISLLGAKYTDPLKKASDLVVNCQRPLIAIYAHLPPLAVILLPEPNPTQQGIMKFLFG
jgi:hypothetical protein